MKDEEAVLGVIAYPGEVHIFVERDGELAEDILYMHPEQALMLARSIVEAAQDAIVLSKDEIRH